MIHSFWAGGPSAYAEGLKAHYEHWLRELHIRLDCCINPAESDEIEREIVEVREEWSVKLQEIDQLLF